MTVSTLSGLYENSRRILRLLHKDHLAQQLGVVASDPKLLTELSISLDALEQHVRVAGLEEVELKGLSGRI